MDITEKAEGFTFWLGNVDYFVLTSRKNKTRGLAEEILAKMGVTKENVLESTWNKDVQILLWRLRKATCKVVVLSDKRPYYEIAGDSFGGLGSYVDDGKTVIINI